MKKAFVIVALAGGVSLLPGCMAVPVVGALTALNSSGTATVELTGSDRGFPAAFRRAVQSAGGVVKSAAQDYGRASFASEGVSIEYQRIENGRYQMVTASEGGVSRAWDFGDSISKKSQTVADALATAGYVVAGTDRKRGL